MANPSNSISDTNMLTNHFLVLPYEVFCYDIISRLPSANDVRSFLLTDKNICQIILNDDSLWMSFIKSHFFISGYRIHHCSYLETYKDIIHVRNNYVLKKFRKSELNGHRSGIQQIKTVPNKLYTFASDQTLTIWDTNKKKALKSLNIPYHIDNYDGSINVYENKLIFCKRGEPGSIVVFDLHTGEELYEINTPNKTMYVKLIHNGQLFCTPAVNWDNTKNFIKIVDVETGKETKTIPLDTDCNVRDVAIHGNKLFVNIMDFLEQGSILSVIDLEKNNIPREISGSRNDAKLVKRGHALYLYEKPDMPKETPGIIKIIDMETEKVVKRINFWNEIYEISHIALMGDLFILMKPSCEYQILKSKNFIASEELSQLECGSAWGIPNALFRATNNQIEFVDLRNPSLSSYNAKVLEENLSIIGQLAHAEHHHQAEEMEKLFNQLHPDFQERMRQHAYRCSGTFQWTKEPILHVQTEICVELLLDRIHTGDEKRVNELLDQLKWIDPDNEHLYKQSIHHVLWELSGIGRVDYGLRYGAFAFTKLYPAYSAKEKLDVQEKAVVRFKKGLTQRWGEDVPLLLLDLGITTKEQYSTKLNCTPDFLPKIGLISLKDLQGLGVCPVKLQKLNANVEKLEGFNTQQTQAIYNKEATADLLAMLQKIVEERIEETKKNGLIYETGENPWIAFQEQLNEFHAKFKSIEESCTHAKILLEQFGPEAFREMANGANTLIEAFEFLDKGHQIAKLRAYVTQWGILRAWENLHLDGIESLNDLMADEKKAPKDLFRMGV